MKERISEEFGPGIARVGRELEELHALLTDGLSGAWSGGAFLAHLEAEDQLYRAAMESLQALRAYAEDLPEKEAAPHKTPNLQWVQ